MSLPPTEPDHRAVSESGRNTLRASLLAARAAFSIGPEAADAQRSLNDNLIDLITALEPDLLGLYWAVRGEFNLARLVKHTKDLRGPRLALPYAQSAANIATSSSENAMEFRLWDGLVPDAKDGCGIPTGNGGLVLPDVVMVPCVGFTRSGYRLGYGGGYFDRWLASRPHVTAIGVAWSGGLVEDAVFDARTHDIALSIVVTEQGVVG